jgi:hypothetical protein
MYLEMYKSLTLYSMQHCNFLAQVQVQAVYFKRSEVAYFCVVNAYESRPKGS